MDKKIWILSAFVLSACGGGGDPVFVEPTGPQGLLDRIDEAVALSGDLDVREGSLASAPHADNATFNGIFIVTENASLPGDTYYGDAQLTVDFTGDGEVTGSAGGFYFYNTSGSGGTVGTSVDGTLGLSASTIGYDNPGTQEREGFALTVSGNLEMGGQLRNVSSSDFEAAFASVDNFDFGNGSDEPIDMLVGVGTTSFVGVGTYDALMLTCTGGLETTCP